MNLPVADELHCLGRNTFVWQAYSPAVKCDLTSTAVKVGDKLVLIDPIPLEESAEAELIEATGVVPSLIVCTNANHARASEHFRKRYGARVLAHEGAIGDLEASVDGVLHDGAGEGFEVLALPGGPPGEVALLFPEGVACFGDSLIHFSPPGFSILPDKYCEDAKVLRRSLRNLLRWDFSVLTFAHGLPIVGEPRRRLEALLA